MYYIKYWFSGSYIIKWKIFTKKLYKNLVVKKKVVPLLTQTHKHTNTQTHKHTNKQTKNKLYYYEKNKS